MNEINERTYSVLEQLEKLVDEINDQVFYVVMGGIAVDGHIGKLTRNHPDVDMIIFREDLEKAELVLHKLGYKLKRFTHPKNGDLEYKMQTGGEEHLFSFQIADKIEENEFEISFYRDPHMIFPLSYIKTPAWLVLEGLKFPTVSKKFLVKLKENEIKYFEQLKKRNTEKYQTKRKQQHLNTMHDLKLLIK